MVIVIDILALVFLSILRSVLWGYEAIKEVIN
ncbi:TPA_asm: hypothetical protein vir520_00014 [Caudoviricetes sp. vir520]|nr:TPA_asm: hypothetical protein vir520_00014 [Caudoviricetes sp. vir520]